MNDKYKTFWSRWTAGFLDGLIFLPLQIINALIRDHVHLPIIINIFWLILYISSRPVYTIWMHGKYGQTIGKKAMNVILLNINETRILNYQESIVRESPYLIMLIVYLNLNIYYLLNGNHITHSTAVLLGVLSYTNLIWFLLEVITTLTNDKRRALHDFLAHSVVIRKEFMS